MSVSGGLRARLLTVPKTIGMLALLQSTAPIDLAVTAWALARRRPVRNTAGVPAINPAGPAARKTVMLSGGKMTKSLALARAFHAAGHRVILVETGRYRLTAHRFSNAVDAFHIVPDATSPDYAAALVAMARRENVDVYVPVCSPVSSRYDAEAKSALQPWCEVLHGGPDDIATVDDKAAFAATAQRFGLAVPQTHRVTSACEVEQFDFTKQPGPFVLKSIEYDPVNRLDLTRLPRPTPEETAAFARSKPISEQNPWILQEFAEGAEYCTHGTARDGALRVYACCESSASQLNYAHVEQPDIEAWVTRFVAELRLTGQYSFDFIVAADGVVRAIECNPRTHSAITMFYDHPGLAAAYLQPGTETITPTPTSKPTYWIYHELWQMLRHPRKLRRGFTTLAEGKDAVFDPDDPWPFFMLMHVHLPSLLLQNLVRLKPWLKIDVNIGKLVEPGGD